jgi:hypothetical protein
VTGAPSFSVDVSPLFRPDDRVQMAFAFDLWSYDEVKANSRSILERIEDGTMPCDAPWPDEQLELFRSWVVGGCRP